MVLCNMNLIAVKKLSLRVLQKIVSDDYCVLQFFCFFFSIRTGNIVVEMDKNKRPSDQTHRLFDILISMVIYKDTFD